MSSHRSAPACVLVGLLLAAFRSEAQTWSAMAQAIPLVSRATPTAEHQSLTEGYLSQPLIMARGSAGWLTALTTLNFEGLTLKRGELTTGAYGEGYVDRRHPHTYVHELMVGAEHTVDGVRVSVFGGRGFVPFGSDDPMVRPLEKYPVNHHLAQLLERVVATSAVAYRSFTLEGATFNGDEPTGPGAWPQFHRFGDSWAARGTWRPSTSMELAASTAHVRSPEIAAGGGLDQDKRSLVARYDASGGPTTRYAMVEWARTVESTTGYQMAYRSVLSEGRYCRAGVTSALRVEQTDRPEEDRTLDPFRTPRPPSDLSSAGTTRWTIASAALSTTVRPLGPLHAAPFVEISAGHPHRLDARALFDPAAFYGSSTLWLASIGARLRVGHMHDRMGRYGAALPAGGMAGMAGMSGMSGSPAMSQTTSARNDRCAE